MPTEPNKPIKGSMTEVLGVVARFKALANMDQDELKSVVQDTTLPFVMRRFVKLITSDDDKMALNAIQFLHSVVTMEASEVDPDVILSPSDAISLTPNQDKIYKRLYKECNGSMMMPGDRELLRLMAVNIDHYNTAKSIVEVVGFHQKFKSGAMNIRPEVAVMNRALENIQTTCKMLGLTTIESAKVGVNVIKKDDPLKKFLS